MSNAPKIYRIINSLDSSLSVEMMFDAQIWLDSNTYSINSDNLLEIYMSM